MTNTYQDRKLAPGSDTPWGRADQVEIITPGLYSVSTPSHGGLFVSPELRKEMPAHLERLAGFASNCSRGWYEEDCDWSIVALAFPQHFPEKVHAIALDSLKYWHRSVYDAHMAANWQAAEALAASQVQP